MTKTFLEILLSILTKFDKGIIPELDTGNAITPIPVNIEILIIWPSESQFVVDDNICSKKYLKILCSNNMS